MSAYSVSPNPVFWPERFGHYRCAITRWDSGKAEVVAWSEGETPDDALNIGAAIVLALNTAVGDDLRRTKAKAEFGGDVIDHLEHVDEWSSDTLQEIAEMAIELDLAHEVDGEFKRGSINDRRDDGPEDEG